MLFLDLDHFKAVNDTLGHEIGDKLLNQVAERLNCCLRQEDTLARLGGDEFILLLPHIRDAEAAINISDKLYSAMDKVFEVDEHLLYVTASTGLALFPENGADATTLLKHADIAMYEAKRNGRAHYQFFSEELQQLMFEKHVIDKSEQKISLSHRQNLCRLTSQQLSIRPHLIRLRIHLHPRRRLI